MLSVWYIECNLRVLLLLHRVAMITKTAENESGCSHRFFLFSCPRPLKWQQIKHARMVVFNSHCDIVSLLCYLFASPRLIDILTLHLHNSQFLHQTLQQSQIASHAKWVSSNKMTIAPMVSCVCIRWHLFCWSDRRGRREIKYVKKKNDNIICMYINVHLRHHKQQTLKSNQQSQNPENCWKF